MMTDALDWNVRHTLTLVDWQKQSYDYEEVHITIC